jgi:hypothetical protein
MQVSGRPRCLLDLASSSGRVRQVADTQSALMELAQQVRMRSGDAGRELHPAVAPR